MIEEPLKHRELRVALANYARKGQGVTAGESAPKAFIAVQRVLDMISGVEPSNRGYPLADAIRYELERTFL